MNIDDFNALDAESARREVAVWAAIPSWVEAVVGGRPVPRRRRAGGCRSIRRPQTGRAPISTPRSHITPGSARA